MVLRNLLRRPTRTLLTLLGIAISVVAVVALGAFADGFGNSFTTVLSSSGADIVVVERDVPDALSSVIDSSVQARISGLAGVSKVSGALVASVSLPDAPYFTVFGLDPREFAIGHYRVVEGRTLNASRQMLLGRSAADTYKKRTGDYFKLHDVAFRVVGLYETGQAIEDNGAVISIDDAQEIMRRPGQVSYYQIKLKDPSVTAHVIADVERRYPGLVASRYCQLCRQPSSEPDDARDRLRRDRAGCSGRRDGHDEHHAHERPGAHPRSACCAPSAGAVAASWR